MITLVDVSKYYGLHAALKNISLHMHAGEIIGVAGVNGSGKTTLLKILFGHPNVIESGGIIGKILLNGTQYNPVSPKIALKNKIGYVSQELSLIPDFTVSENIFLGREETFFKNKALSDIHIINKKKEHCLTDALIDRFNVPFKRSTMASLLNASSCQYVEILRAISNPSLKILLFDEPTTYLNKHEARVVLQCLRDFARCGGLVVYVSHRIYELIDVSDRIIILRDGILCNEFIKNEFEPKKIIHEMSESFTIFTAQKKTRPSTKDILNFKNISSLNTSEVLKKFNLKVPIGSITGLAAYAGHGREALAHVVSGAVKSTGEIVYKNVVYTTDCLDKLIKNSFYFFSPERRNIGLLQEKSIWENMVFNLIACKKKNCSIFGMPKVHICKKIAGEYVDKMNIRCSSVEQPVKQLSGGNQQKVALARAFLSEPDFMFINEPTRGIDIASKEIILSFIEDANQNKNITMLISSSEIEEQKRICDTIAVLYEGRCILENNSDAPLDDFINAMSGVI